MMDWYINLYTHTKYFEEPSIVNCQTVPYYRHHFARDYTIRNDTVYFKNVIMLNIEHYYKILSTIKKVVFNEKTVLCSNGPFVLLPNITHVTFGEKFNQSFVLTRYLVCVRFGTFFNKKLVLTSAIHRVHIGECFGQSVVLGKNVNVMSILCCSNTPFKLNKKMEYFVFRKFGPYTFCSGLSKNLKYFVTNADYEQHVFLPKHLVYLNFTPIVGTIIYPPYIKYLVINNKCMHCSVLDKISKNLHLRIDFVSNSKIVNNLPNGLKCIEVTYADQKKYFDLPNDFYNPMWT